MLSALTLPDRVTGLLDRVVLTVKIVNSNMEVERMKVYKSFFRVWPVGLSPRNYRNLGDIVADFNKSELNAASICLCCGATIIQELDTQAILDVLFI